MTKNGLILISFAWTMEIVGVAGGAINSAYTTFGDDLPTNLAGYVPAVPMVALAAAELGRVPLASVFYHKDRIMQVVAVFGIVALGYIAVENWTFGFERVVDLRLKPVNDAHRELQRAEAELSGLKEQRDRTVAGSDRKREELRAGISQRDTAIADLNAQLSKEAEAHQKNLEGIREACRIIRDRCMVPRSTAEDARYAAAVGRLGADLERQRDEKKALQTRIDALVSADAAEAAEFDREVAAAASRATEASKAFRTAAEGNQILSSRRQLVRRGHLRRYARAVRDRALGVLDLQRHRGCTRRQRRGPRLLLEQSRSRQPVVSRDAGRQGSAFTARLLRAAA